MGGTAGRFDKLRAFLPTFFEELHVTAPDTNLIGSEASIHSRTNTTGFTTRKINVSLRDKNQNVVVDISNARLSLYSGKMEDAGNGPEVKRHPALRVIWKPDITRLEVSRTSELDAYIEQFLSEHHSMFENTTVGVMAALLDLAGHKNPRIRILELDRDCDCKSRQWRKILHEGTDFPRFKAWESGIIADEEITIIPYKAANVVRKMKLEGKGHKEWDILLLPQVSLTRKH